MSAIIASGDPSSVDHWFLLPMPLVRTWRQVLLLPLLSWRTKPDSETTNHRTPEIDADDTRGCAPPRPLMITAQIRGPSEIGVPRQSMLPVEVPRISPQLVIRLNRLKHPHLVHLIRAALEPDQHQDHSHRRLISERESGSKTR